jgi:DNA-binding MurR/RpiR family transcriptional regulator
MNVFSKIRTKYNRLSPTQKKIADFVLKNSEQVPTLTLNAIAKECNTSETTVIRFLRKLDFNSFQVFRVNVAQTLSSKTPNKAIYQEIQANDSIQQIKEKVIMSTVSSIEDLNELVDVDKLEKCVELLLNAERIFFFGVGASFAIAMDAYHKLSRLGLNVANQRDAHMINILSTHTTENDLLFVVSHSGESQEILDGVVLSKENDSKIIALTSYENSSLVELADLTILSSTNETRYRSDAMISRIIQLVIIDMIYISLVLKLGTEDSIEKVNKSRLAVARRKT